MNRVKSTVFLGVLLSGLTLAAPSLTLTLLKVGSVTEGGKAREVLSPASSVKPGDLLVQRAVLSSEKALVSGHIVVPVPKNTRYLANSALTVPGLVSDFSADGGKTFSGAPTRTVKVEGGTQTKVVPVPQDEYTTVRWTIETVPAGASTTVSFRVVVN